MTPELRTSYAYCRQIARSRAKNFYYSFLLLDRPRRDAMCAIYAFMRICDDLSDEGGGAGEAAIEGWRAELCQALTGNPGPHPIWLAVADTVSRYRIPEFCFHEMIQGVKSDLQPRRLLTFDELYRYCYQVASVVGLTVIYVLGFEGGEAPKLAELCGIAFQLTNILRDVKEDSEMDRIYLPAEDLARFGVHDADLRAGAPSPAFLELMRFEAARAKDYYHRSAPLLGMVSPEGRPMLWAIIEIYSRLLARMESAGFDVLSRRIALPTWEKLAILAQGCLRR